MWDTRVSGTGDHSGAWPRKGSGLVGVRHPHLRDVGGVSQREGERKKERERERERGGGRAKGREREGRERERERRGRGREREALATWYFSIGTLRFLMSTHFGSMRRS